MSAPPAESAGPVPAHATMLIARIARVVRQRFELALEPLGLRQRHVVALSYLRGHGPTAQQVLAERLCMDPSSTVGLLNDLEDHQLVLRRRDRSDRRRALIELTSEGERALADVDRALQCVEDHLLAGLDGGERSQLRDLLAKLGHNEVDWEAAAEG
ncbi:MarR family winged helix-turn-helix transcriptional regulator [Conexibacter sp. DBS9H8]|uniref:MarR family winged helix-turn-helix transcriptional regulator n=1 Tax=Conexibacter sp. DBS9H8 TaxID=2937801 RepID=UPI0020108028|nr:MarR family winged helix-turn-helix transcriptional regulator [Conexibacter sp. DBS9H8]